MKKHARGGHGSRPGPGGPHRARRGATVDAVLLLLGERPMHGYEIIAELDERSEGNWRPSPGSIYPALRRMEAKGFVSGEDDDEGKRIYGLTELGQERLEDRDPDAPSPWELFAEEGASLRPIVHELVSQTRQVGRFGTPEQREKAKEILLKAKADLYAVMV